MLYGNNIPFLVAIEFIILGYDKGELKMLATKKHNGQGNEKWSLISCFLEEDENLKQAAAHI